MKRYWYQRILIMVVVFTVTVGGSYYLLEREEMLLEREVAAAAVSDTLVVPGGMPIGIYLETDGVMILGTDEITGMDGMEHDPAENLVKPGDYITGMNGEEIQTKEELVRAVGELSGEDVVLTVRRGSDTIDIKLEAVKTDGNEYKLGIWVRDNVQGIGTITFLCADSRFGALGHGIHDMDTSELMDISEGRLYITSIKDVKKGETGAPGGMEGIIIYNHYNVLGEISKNTEAGIFGTIERIDALFTDQTPMEAAAVEEMEEGPAVIRCAVEGEVKEYDIQVTKVDAHADEVNKGLTIEVTDEALLEAAGGIVQGMSGSPIIQNGKLIGAVTHVFVNDPTKGYGIFIEEMLEQS